MPKRFSRPRLPVRLPAFVVTEEMHQQVTTFSKAHNVSIAEVMRAALEEFFLPENIEKFNSQVEKVNFKQSRKEKRGKS